MRSKIRAGNLVSGLAALLLLVWCCVPAAAGEGAEGYVDVRAVREAAAGGWHEVVEAHGRRIEIALDNIAVPAADAMPVLKIRQSAYDRAALGEGFAIQWEDETGLSVEKGSMAYEALPPGAGVKWTYHGADGQIDWGERAEAHPMTATDVRDLLLGHIEALYGPAMLDTVFAAELTADSRVYWADNKTADLTDDPYTDMGTYSVRMQQHFGGVPVLTYVHLPEPNGYQPMPATEAAIYLTDADHYSLSASLAEVAEVVAPDIPLRPFADVQAMLRGLIEAGHLRGVESLQLGYAVFADPDEAGLAWLIPTWVATGEYYQTPEEDNLFLQEPFASDPSYRDARVVSTITADAQTLRPIDPLAHSMQTGGFAGEAPDASAILLWQEVRP